MQSTPLKEKSIFLSSSFFSLTGYNMVVMAGVWMAILNHEVESYIENGLTTARKKQEPSLKWRTTT